MHGASTGRALHKKGHIVMLGLKTQAYLQIAELTAELLEGTVVCIDPSIGSTSSMPGWAVYRKTVLLASGIFRIDNTWSTPERLKHLHRYLLDLYAEYPPPDVLVYEDIPARRQGRGNAAGHASLLKAVGAILAAPGPVGHVGLMPISWKSMARDTYRKSDEADAIEMGWVAMEAARYIVDKKKKGGRASGKSK
jgi:hypothetical protein